MSQVSQASLVPYAWRPIGQLREVTIYSHRQRLNMLGFLSRAGKRASHTTTETVTTETVIKAFNQFVAQKDPNTFAVVVLNNAIMHRTKAFRRKTVDWVSQHMHLIYLSAYSSELNLIKVLWRPMKYTWLHLSAYICDEVPPPTRWLRTERAINFE